MDELELIKDITVKILDKLASKVYSRGGVMGAALSVEGATYVTSVKLNPYEACLELKSQTPKRIAYKVYRDMNITTFRRLLRAVKEILKDLDIDENIKIEIINGLDRIRKESYETKYEMIVENICSYIREIREKIDDIIDEIEKFIINKLPEEVKEEARYLAFIYLLLYLAYKYNKEIS